MKKRIGFLLFFFALFATTQTKAQQTFKAQNNTPCQYKVSIYVAPTGTCSGPYSPITVPVPPFFSGLLYTTPPGTWAVGAGFPAYGPTFGISSPLPGPCSSFPTSVSFVNSCMVPVTAQYIQGPTLTTSSGIVIF